MVLVVLPRVMRFLSSSILAVCLCACSVTGGSSDRPDQGAADGGETDGSHGGFAEPQVGDPGPGGAGPEGGAGGGPAPELPAFEAGPLKLHRLTNRQYRHSLRDLLGDSAPVGGDLEPDTSLHGFTTIGATELTVSPRGAELYEETARLAGSVAKTGSGCADADAGCLSAYLDTFVRRAWRRPVSDDELAELRALAVKIEARLPGEGFAHALALVLQSPFFLFRVELGEADPEHAGRLRFTDWEMATRLSFALWETTPDDELLDAAARGELTNIDGLKAQAERLLQSPRAQQGIARFFEEHLTLDRLGDMSKDQAKFPQMSPSLAAAMRQEVLDVVQWLTFDEDADAMDLLTTTTTFIDGELAALYGLPYPGEGGGHRVEQPEGSPRGGLLGMAALLALNSHPSATSPTLRGRFIQQNLRCVDVPPPPPGVVTNLAAAGGDGVPLTVREKLEAHRADPACQGCHSIMDPLGIGLESFDAIGAYRTTEDGRPVDAQSELAGVPFEGPAELGELLHDDPKVSACLARRFYRYATGRLEGRKEERVVRQLAEDFQAAGRRVKALVIETVLSDGFRYASRPAEEAP